MLAINIIRGYRQPILTPPYRAQRAISVEGRPYTPSVTPYIIEVNIKID